MTDTQEKIFEVFKKHKTPKDGVIKPQSFDIRNWDRRIHDEFQDAIGQLITDNYVSTKDGWYVLTEKGYNHIYSNYTIEDTIELILDVFRKHKVIVGEILMQNHFIKPQQDMDRFHFDNFSIAMQKIIVDGLIELTKEGCYKLTQFGYNRIY